MQRTIQIWADDQPGALMRVAGVLTANGANIASLTASQDPAKPGLCCITLQTDLDEQLHGNVMKQLSRLANVRSAHDTTESGGPAW